MARLASIDRDDLGLYCFFQSAAQKHYYMNLADPGHRAIIYLLQIIKSRLPKCTFGVSDLTRFQDIDKLVQKRKYGELAEIQSGGRFQPYRHFGKSPEEQKRMNKKELNAMDKEIKKWSDREIMYINAPILQETKKEIDYFEQRK